MEKSAAFYKNILRAKVSEKVVCICTQSHPAVSGRLYSLSLINEQVVIWLQLEAYHYLMGKEMGLSNTIVFVVILRITGPSGAWSLHCFRGAWKHKDRTA
jgi:hypothetical protein